MACIGFVEIGGHKHANRFLQIFYNEHLKKSSEMH